VPGWRGRGFAGHESGEPVLIDGRGRLGARKRIIAAGRYGDLQGIAGKTLQEIEGLDIKVLPATQEP